MRGIINDKFEGCKEYKPGNHFVLRIGEGDAAAGESRWGWQYDGAGAAKAARLIIEFTAPSEIFVEPIKNWSFEDGSGWTVIGGSNSSDSANYMHGKRSWAVSGGTTQDLVVWQALSNDVVEYIRNRKAGQKRGVCFSFWYRPDSVNNQNGEKNKALAQIVYYDGSWHTVNGSTVKPDNATVWWHAQANVSLPTNTEQARVRIVGKPYSGEGFKARIDLASLSVYYYAMNVSAYGNATLTTNIYYSNAIPHPEWDGFVSLGFGISAKAKDGYSVANLKDLTVELLPNNGSATTQDGRLVILYLTQQNSKNWTIRDLPLERVNIAFDTGQLGAFITNVILAEAVTVGLIVAFPPAEFAWGPIAAKMFITGAAQIKTFFTVRRVALEHPLAEGGTSYKVYETLDYSGHLGTDISDRINYTGAQYYFDWRFRTTTDDVFAIRVSATVEWWQWDPLAGLSGMWVYAGETTLTFVISLANYWQ